MASWPVVLQSRVRPSTVVIDRRTDLMPKCRRGSGRMIDLDGPSSPSCAVVRRQRAAFSQRCCDQATCPSCRDRDDQCATALRAVHLRTAAGISEVQLTGATDRRRKNGGCPVWRMNEASLKRPATLAHGSQSRGTHSRRYLTRAPGAAGTKLGRDVQLLLRSGVTRRTTTQNEGAIAPGCSAWNALGNIDWSGTPSDIRRWRTSRTVPPK
jgi:hypothetical protein